MDRGFLQLDEDILYKAAGEYQARDTRDNGSKR
jgi:hypothetical protein